MQLAFEPVTSEEYDMARCEYSYGLKFLKDKVLARSHQNLERACFTVCVSMLRDLYRQGQVESIDSLPLPHEVNWFDQKDLRSLARKLGQLYFPDGNHH